MTRSEVTACLWSQTCRFRHFLGHFGPKNAIFEKKIDFLHNGNSYYFWILGLALVLHFKNGSSENGHFDVFSLLPNVFFGMGQV